MKKTKIISYVILPDHVHLIMQSEDYSTAQIMDSLKWNFQKNRELLRENGTNLSLAMSLWPSKFWEHVILDNNDLHFHVNYIVNNPVKHGYVDDPEDWPYSSFAQYATNDGMAMHFTEITI